MADTIDVQEINAAADRLHNQVIAIKSVWDMVVRNLDPSVDPNRINGWQGQVDAAVRNAAQARVDIDGELFETGVAPQSPDAEEPTAEPGEAVTASPEAPTGIADMTSE